MENFPSSFAEVPNLVPLIITDAPGTALPSASVIFPVIVRFWAAT